MAQKVVDADMIETIRRGAKAGLTASQIAATLDVVVTTVRRHAYKHGIALAKAHSTTAPPSDDKQIKQLNLAAAAAQESRRRSGSCRWRRTWQKSQPAGAQGGAIRPSSDGV